MIKERNSREVDVELLKEIANILDNNTRAMSIVKLENLFYKRRKTPKWKIND